ncbi:rhamnan synthesis protein F family [Rhodobacter capsulatus]|uniref:rhamnan synthesis F family protein n=1 Tax=Rhodobacter capsulatus TaxID=1061 RepID=UPI0006DCBEDD|nr:rhamnan synthesis F family protein [Rhodobacter capsulatus]KQB12949.1 rhamnan synthesis protein F family [Rhodobacter capsulatus]KQB15806.1 rhamnan synthesis protein F family [Rhodobacter capsulatus]PZX28443.1 rhamnan synthesis protein F [Rhodobacter capsulatus]QNR62721.1 rhamnan synthesis protein F family [Rhodobacter capsulatus]
MVPAWKIKRELNRIKDQILQLPRTLASLPGRLREPARRKAYLRDFDRLTKRHAGRLPMGQKIAIFLIYQPHGISPSAIATCNWLISEGYAPFLVLNCPVSEADRDRLLDLCWSLLERPNFGYDFGGYQDAIRLLNREGARPERLIVMNDSIWAPMRTDLLAQLETDFAAVDICGLLQDEKVIHDTSGGRPSTRSHVESYFYLIRRSAWDHPAFQAFWRDYQMTDYKPHTIKFGEIGFSRQMAAAGLKLDAFSRREAFLQLLREKDDAFLRQTLKYAAYADADRIKAARRIAALDPASPGWRAAVLDHIRRTVNRKRFNASFPFANDHIFGTAFLKKSGEPIFANMRAAYLRALEDGAVAEPPAEIRAEIAAMVAQARSRR